MFKLHMIIMSKLHGKLFKLFLYNIIDLNNFCPKTNFNNSFLSEIIQSYVLYPAFLIYKVRENMILTANFICSSFNL